MSVSYLTAHGEAPEVNGDKVHTGIMGIPRTIEAITAEVWLFKQQAGAAILEIGRRLIEAKSILSHGEWLPWLEEKVEFSEATAQRFMRLAREYENPSTVTDLGASKALILLALPASEREEFAAEKHTVNGQEKTVEEMSSRELKKAIAERDAALLKAKEAESAVDQLKKTAEDAEKEASDYKAMMEEAKKTAEEQSKKAEEELDTLREQLEQLQSEPITVDVGVQPIVDEEAIKAAADAARKEAEEKLKAKIDKAEKAKEKAEQAKAKAEQDLSSLKVAQEEADAIAKKEKESMEERVQELQKKLAIASSSETAIFKLHFEQGKESVNKMIECISKMAEAGDPDGAAKLKNALIALMQSTLGALNYDG